MTTRDAASARPLDFLARRFLRVAPLYWLLTALVANVAVLMTGLSGATVFVPWHTFASFAFWPTLHPVIGLYNPLLLVGWTLNCEMAFYALFALALCLPARGQVPAACGALALVALAGLALGPGGAAGFYTDLVILEFALGLGIGTLHGTGLRLPRAACLALVAAGALLMLGAVQANRLPTAGVPAALLVAGAVFAEHAAGPWRIPFLKRLGDASYSIYLVHLPIAPLAQIAWRRLGLGAEGVMGLLYSTAAVLVCLAAGLAFHRLVEAPLGRLLRSTFQRRAAGVRSVAAQPVT